MADQQPETPNMANTNSNGEGSSSSTTQPSESQLSPPKCSSCAKPSPSEDKPLKPCPKCHTTAYCTKECQKNDFKKHKKVCAQLAQEYAKNADFKMVSGGRPPAEGHRGGLQKWQFDT